ncbi:5' nucleotidase, NT5C type [Rhodococcoides fascians]|uniref:5' nucleotidase, NT5C type n=1 Tax=Rhodococcoides fascians TaxID=1828 RepID=UPI00050C9B62|nr:5'-3'-deoxyribonucleotidase [Rhodococcus fascians]
MAKKTLYVDLDNTLVNFQSGIDRADPADIAKYPNDLDEVPHIFSLMDPIDGALDAYRTLAAVFDTYILSTAPWKNPSAWHDKVLWVQKHLGFDEGSVAYKRLILSHHKNLNRGDFLVDDRRNNGASEFEGEWLRYGTEPFETWDQVTAHLLERA